MKLNHWRISIIAGLAIALTGCGSSTHSSSDHQQSPSRPEPTQVDLPSTPSSTVQLSLEGFAVIREFGEGDTAALFGILPENGKAEITGIAGPTFLGGARVGELNQVALDHLFTKSSVPMNALERQELIAKYAGAQAIYFEGYKGALCKSDETEFVVTVSGNFEGKTFKSAFQFIALPSSEGDCTFHKFITQTQN